MTKTKFNMKDNVINEIGMPVVDMTPRRQFKTPYNAHLFVTKGEVNRSPSKTIPDQSMSVRELMARYAQGLPLSGARVPIYDGDTEFVPMPETLDLAERQAMAEEAADLLATSREKLRDIQAQKRKYAQSVFEFEKSKGEKQYPKKTAPPLGGGGGENASGSDRLPREAQD